MGQEEAFSRKPAEEEAEMKTLRLWRPLDPAAHAYSDGNFAAGTHCDPTPPSSSRWRVGFDLFQIL